MEKIENRTDSNISAPSREHLKAQIEELASLDAAEIFKGIRWDIVLQEIISEQMRFIDPAPND